MNLGQERDFYGGPDDKALDDAITRGEQKLAETVQRLNSNERTSDRDIAALIAALSFRTMAMMMSLIAMVPEMLAAGRSHILGGGRLRDVL